MIDRKKLKLAQANLSGSEDEAEDIQVQAPSARRNLSRDQKIAIMKEVLNS